LSSGRRFINKTVIPDAQLRIADAPSVGESRPEAQARNDESWVIPRI
jgi:hypothetical protein